MRLLNDKVQICHNEVWGYVCTDYSSFGWTDDDASVVCRELGLFHQGVIYPTPQNHNYNLFNLSIFSEGAQLQWIRGAPN